MTKLLLSDAAAHWVLAAAFIIIVVLPAVVVIGAVLRDRRPNIESNP